MSGAVLLSDFVRRLEEDNWNPRLSNRLKMGLESGFKSRVPKSWRIFVSMVINDRGWSEKSDFNMVENMLFFLQGI